MYVEKRIGGDYYQYVISITTYNPEQAAIRTLKWYVNYLNQRLFQSCYSYELTHGECFLIIHLKESEYKDTESRSIFLQICKKEFHHLTAQAFCFHFHKRSLYIPDVLQCRQS